MRALGVTSPWRGKSAPRSTAKGETTISRPNVRATSLGLEFDGALSTLAAHTLPLFTSSTTRTLALGGVSARLGVGQICVRLDSFGGCPQKITTLEVLVGKGKERVLRELLSAQARGLDTV